MTEPHGLHKIKQTLLTLIIVTVLPLIGGGYNSIKAQMDPDAVGPALTELLRRHSTAADTIAKELSKRFYKSAPMQMAIARAYHRAGETQKTRYYIKRAMAADAKFTPAYIMYGDMYSQWNVDSAAYWFERAIEANPKSPDGYTNYAQVMARKDLNKAILKLEELRQAIPYYNVDIEISSLHSKLGDDKAAVAAMQGVDPHTLTMNQTAQYMQSLYWSSEHERVMEVGKIAMERFPENRGFGRVYAWSASRKGYYADAIAAAEAWLTHAPYDSINCIDYLCIGTSYVGIGKYEKAFEYLNRINGLTEDYFFAQMPGQIARMVNSNVEELKAGKRYKEAADLYARYIETFPSTSDPAFQYYSLAQIYRSWQEELTGEEQKAIIKKMFDAYDVIEERYADWSNIHFVLYTHARWTYSYFDPENAQSLALPYYEKLYNTLEKRRSLSEQETAMIAEACQYIASDSYFQKQDLTKARLWWNRILKYDPENQAAKDALEKIKE